MPVYRIQFNRPNEKKVPTPDPEALRGTGPCVPVVIEIPSALARRYEREERLIPDPIHGYALFGDRRVDVVSQHGLSRSQIAGQQLIDRLDQQVFPEPRVARGPIHDGDSECACDWHLFSPIHR